MNLAKDWIEVWFADPRIGDDLAAATVIVHIKTFDWDKVMSYATGVSVDIIPHQIVFGTDKPIDLYHPFKHGGWDEVLAIVESLKSSSTGAPAHARGTVEINFLRTR